MISGKSKVVELQLREVNPVVLWWKRFVEQVGGQVRKSKGIMLGKKENDEMTS